LDAENEIKVKSIKARNGEIVFGVMIQNVPVLIVYDKLIG